VLSVLQLLSKVSADEVFMHYFEKMSPASGGFASKLSPRFCPWTSLADVVLQTPSIAHPGKNPAGAHQNSTEILLPQPT